jgi:hypothetical protein
MLICELVAADAGDQVFVTKRMGQALRNGG